MIRLKVIFWENRLIFFCPKYFLQVKIIISSFAVVKKQKKVIKTKKLNVFCSCDIPLKHCYSSQPPVCDFCNKKIDAPF